MKPNKTKSESFYESTSFLSKVKVGFGLGWIFWILLVFSLILLILYFIFFPSQDKTPPVISDLQSIDTTASSTVITWITNEPADGIINFGISTSTATSTVIANMDMVLNHMSNISDLNASTTYYYFVTSADESGNTATSSVQSFTTLTLPETSDWKNIRVTETSVERYLPQVAWDGTGYGIAWNDNRGSGEPETYFARVDENGTKIVNDVQITNNPNKISYCGDIVWTGSEYGIVWAEYSRYRGENASDCYLYFARVDLNGNKIGNNVLVTSDNYGLCPSSPSMVWTGSEYGITWSENRAGTETPRIFFTRLDSNAIKQGEDIQVSDSTAAGASLVWNGSEYAVFWGSRLARLNAEGVKQGSEISLDVSASSVVWNGSNYGVTWVDYSGGTRQIFFAKLDQNGNQQGNSIMLTSNSGSSYSNAPAIIVGSSGYGITWHQSGDTIYFVDIDTNGNKQGIETQISDATSGQAMHPRIVWNSSGYAVVWQDSRHYGTEIYFAKSGP